MRLPLWLVLLAACGSDPPTPAVDAPPVAVDAGIDAPEGPCGLRGGARGSSRREVTIAGLRRTYLVYLPPGVAPSKRIPLVYVHHGYTMSGQNMFDATAYAALADTEQIAVAFPDGQGGPGTLRAPWNVGSNVCPSTAGAPPNATDDDFPFLDAMRMDIAADQCIDTDHVFVTGFSMGGYFSHHAGCMRPDIRAIAPHSGGTHSLGACPSAKKPVIIFHGLADSIIPPGCNDPASTPPPSVVPAALAWAQHNGCATTTTDVAVTGGTCKVYDGCPAGGQVSLCTFTGMGHCWAGGPSSAGAFACPAYAQATMLEWQFFRQHAW